MDTSHTNQVDIRVYPGGRLVVHAFSLRELVAIAFDLPGWNLVGATPWMSELRFNVEGKPADDLRAAFSQGEYSNMGIADPRIRTMLQSLLIERFHLRFHIEQHPGTVYLLQRGNGPLRLSEVTPHLYRNAQDGTVMPTNESTTDEVGLAAGAPVGFYRTSMNQFASFLSGTERAPVLDQTGLPGFYDFRSQTIVTDEDFQTQAVFHLLLDAVPEMGLKLVKAQGTVNRFVLDSAQPPSEN